MNRSYSKIRHIQKANMILESRMNLLNEEKSNSEDCLKNAGWEKKEIGGPQVRRNVYRKKDGDSTYEIGFNSDGTLLSKVTIRKSESNQECSSWTCDDTTTLGITYSGCKTKVMGVFK